MYYLCRRIPEGTSVSFVFYRTSKPYANMMQASGSAAMNGEKMNIQELTEFVEKELSGTDYYLIDVSSEPGERYIVEIDSDEGVDIDFCASLTRAIDEAFPRDDDSTDYELEVGSSGLTSPFKVYRQYLKNIGQDVEILTNDGRKLHAILREAAPDSFTVEYAVKEKLEGAKRPVEVKHRETFPYSAVKMVRVDLKF